MRKITSVALGLAAASALSVLGAAPAHAATAPSLAVTAPAPAHHALAPTARTASATGSTAADDGSIPAAPSCEDLTDPAAFFELLETVPIPGFEEVLDTFLSSIEFPDDLVAPFGKICEVSESGGVPSVPEV